MKQIFYFGCIDHPGHYLFDKRGRTNEVIAAGLMPGINKALLRFLDGLFTPGATTRQGAYKVNIVPPVIIISWWDYTGDNRGGSNSNLIAYGYDETEPFIDHIIIGDAQQLYPKVFKRQPPLFDYSKA